VTHGSLMRDIPRLEPDDELVDRLAELAAASKPTRGGIVVPVAFQGPVARSLATAAAVAAIAAGATVAATQLGHPHDNDPVPPITSVGPSGADDDHGSRHTRTAREADPSQTNADRGEPAGHDSSGPDSSSTTGAEGPTTDDHGSPGSDDSPGGGHTGSPGDDPSNHESGDHSGSGPGSGGSDGPGGGSDDSGGGSGDGPGGGSGGKDSGGGSDSASDVDGSGD
jgi:predicted transcriptional regulator